MVAPSLEGLEGLDRPVAIVVEHGVRSRACGPTDRPHLLTAVPKELKCLAAVGGKGAVRPLDRADA
eukprot:961630-Alexandrium_andersonii.AAC.1